jgi:hypothetical protein
MRRLDSKRYQETDAMPPKYEAGQAFMASGPTLQATGLALPLSTGGVRDGR